MKPYLFLISLFLVVHAIQIRGDDTVTLEGSIDGSVSQSHEVWIGVFELPIRRGAEAVSWTLISSEKFTLELPDSNEVQIVALHRDALPLFKRISPRLTDATIHLKFEEGLSMKGTVLSTDNIPIENAGLTVKPEGLPNIQIPEHVRFYWLTDTGGKFKMGGLSPNTSHEIGILLPHAPNETFIVKISGRDKNDQDLRLSNAFFVTGRVLDTDQEPVQGANITSRFTTERGGAVAASDEKGKFRIGPFVRNKDLWLTARHEEFGSSKRLLTTSGEHDLKLVLSRMVQVIGTVLDASTGEPMDSFSIRAIRSDGSRDYSFAKSRGEIAVLVDPQTIGLIVDSEEHIAQVSTELDLESLDKYDLGVVALEQGRQLVGRVFDAASGQPIGGATISLRDYRWKGSLEGLRIWFDILLSYQKETVQATTDASGELTLMPLPADSTQISVEARDYQSQELQVDPTSTILDIRLEKDESKNARIRGRIESSTGDPLSGTVSFTSESAVIQRGVHSDGLFDYLLEAGTYDVIAITDQGNSETEEVVLSQNEVKDIRLVVDSKGRVTGIIEGLELGETVSLELVSDPGGVVLRSLMGVENGEFVIDGIGIGAFALFAYAWMNREKDKSFEITADSGEVYVEFDFSGNSRLFGTVRYSDGSVPSGEVKAKALVSGNTSVTSYISSDGAYEISGLDEGEYSVHLSQRREIRMERDGGTFTTKVIYDIDQVEVNVEGATELNFELPSPSEAIIEIGD
ncbi:MAG: carboxypeptidase-like regulatory domain-containing protein [Gammaproteobacteria bacterium]|nr:carboxypeptidase-like regulatory domain-containing protein [Gammaproteobacteria bacterium]